MTIYYLQDNNGFPYRRIGNGLPFHSNDIELVQFYADQLGPEWSAVEWQSPSPVPIDVSDECTCSEEK